MGSFQCPVSSHRCPIPGAASLPFHRAPNQPNPPPCYFYARPAPCLLWPSFCHNTHSSMNGLSSDRRPCLQLPPLPILARCTDPSFLLWRLTHYNFLCCRDRVSISALYKGRGRLTECPDFKHPGLPERCLARARLVLCGGALLVWGGTGGTMCACSSCAVRWAAVHATSLGVPRRQTSSSDCTAWRAPGWAQWRRPQSGCG